MQRRRNVKEPYLCEMCHIRGTEHFHRGRYMHICKECIMRSGQRYCTKCTTKKCTTNFTSDSTRCKRCVDRYGLPTPPSQPSRRPPEFQQQPLSAVQSHLLHGTGVMSQRQSPAVPEHNIPIPDSLDKAVVAAAFADNCEYAMIDAPAAESLPSGTLLEALPHSLSTPPDTEREKLHDSNESSSNESYLESLSEIDRALIASNTASAPNLMPYLHHDLADCSKKM